MTTLEKMARATYADWIKDVRDLEPSWDDLPPDFTSRMIDASRAALLEIREPSREAVLSGDAAYARAGSVPGIFTAMIDAILEGEA